MSKFPSITSWPLGIHWSVPFLPLGSLIEGTTQTIIALIGPIRPARWSSRPRTTSRRCRQGVTRCSAVRCLVQDRRVRDLPGQGWPLRPDDACPRLRGDAAAARGLSTDARSGLGGRSAARHRGGGRPRLRTDQLLIEVVKAGRVRFPIGKTAFEEAHDPRVSTMSACLGRPVRSWLPCCACTASRRDAPNVIPHASRKNAAGPAPTCRRTESLWWISAGRQG
jgi:hypothetical protein